MEDADAAVCRKEGSLSSPKIDEDAEAMAMRKNDGEKQQAGICTEVNGEQNHYSQEEEQADT